jgi:hypothetical protein
MACAELDRLERQYEFAVASWKRQGFAPLVAGGVLKQTTGGLGREVSARNIAAEHLYLHRLHCSICKQERVLKKTPTSLK